MLWHKHDGDEQSEESESQEAMAGGRLGCTS